MLLGTLLAGVCKTANSGADFIFLGADWLDLGDVEGQKWAHFHQSANVLIVGLIFSLALFLTLKRFSALS